MTSKIQATILLLGEQSDTYLSTLQARFTQIEQLSLQTDPTQYLNTYGHQFDIVATSNQTGIDGKMIDALPNLKLIASFGVGFDSIDIDYAHSKQIIVTNTPHVLNDCVADTAMMLMYALSRQLLTADRFVRSGQWGAGSFPLTSSLAKKNCAILGMGKIGQAIAQRAEAAGMNIIYHNRQPKTELNYTYIETLEQLAADADMLVLALPSTATTQHIVNARILKKMKPSAFIVNIARGAVIDELALITSLIKKEIAGAGLDVFEVEPSTESPLFKLDNVILTPHYASGTHETRQAMADLVAANIQAYIQENRVLTAV